jgi:hypothetical protein
LENGSSSSSSSAACQRAGQRHALLLAAESSCGNAPQLGTVESSAVDPRRALGRRRAAQAEATFSLDREVRKQRVILNTMPTWRFSGGTRYGTADDRVVDQDLAARDLLETGNAAQQGRLAATRGAEQAGDTPCSRRKSTPFTMVWRP